MMTESVGWSGHEMGRPGLIFEVCIVRGSYRCIVFS